MRLPVLAEHPNLIMATFEVVWAEAGWCWLMLASALDAVGATWAGQL